MGEMFHREQPMSEILAASDDTLRYFDGWSQAIKDAETKAWRKAQKKGK